MRLKKGDIVSRLSYDQDIAFFISDIIKINSESIAILKGLTIRIEADAPLYDLKLIEEDRIYNLLKEFNNNLENAKGNYLINKTIPNKRSKVEFGKILHLDGDRKYSEKSQRFYKNLGLDVTVKNIKESRQPQLIEYLLCKYNPDVLVITGHDGMIKKGYNFNDIYNYRNSKYFVETVIRARMWEQGANRLAIFAGACQSYYEAIMEAGANFASSPARILIDFKDPLIVAEQIAKTDADSYISIENIKNLLRDGERGVSGIGTLGKKINR